MIEEGRQQLRYWGKEDAVSGGGLSLGWSSFVLHVYFQLLFHLPQGRGVLYFGRMLFARGVPNRLQESQRSYRHGCQFTIDFRRANSSHTEVWGLRV